MKLFRMIGRSIRDAFKSVIRNFSLSLASISCITITLVIVAIAIIASFNVNNFTSEIEKDLTIVVFLDNDVTEAQIKDVKSDLEDITNIEKPNNYGYKIGRVKRKIKSGYELELYTPLNQNDSIRINHNNEDVTITVVKMYDLNDNLIIMIILFTKLHIFTITGHYSKVRREL